MIVSCSNLACTKKKVWTRIHIKQFFEILNILASRRGWTGEIFRGFEEKTWFHHVRETESEYGMGLRNDETNHYFWCTTLFLELKLIEIYIFILYHFSTDKIDPKVIGFLLTTTTVIINLGLLTLAFPKSHKNLLKPTF